MCPGNRYYYQIIWAIVDENKAKNQDLIEINFQGNRIKNGTIIFFLLRFILRK